MLTERELQFSSCKLNRKHLFKEGAFKINIVPLKQAIKKTELLLNYKIIKINQARKVSIYERNCLPQTT